MANRHNGEVSITGASGTTYTLKNSFKGMVAVEEMFGLTFDEVTNLSDKGSKKHLRAIIWALFLHRQPDVTIDGLDDVIDDCGGLTAMMVTVMKTVKASLPDAKDLEALGVLAEIPLKAQAVTETESRTTGEDSTSKLAVPA